jgi:hypothetical protein
MGAKSDKRAARQALIDAKFELSKAAIIAKVGNLSEPKTQVRVNGNESPRVAPHLVRKAAELASTPKAIVEGSRFSSLMTYCVSRKDHDNEWSWAEPRAWSAAEWMDDIEPPLEHFSGLTWGEIDRLASGASHKMHHSHEIGQLIEEAKQRWISLGLEQFDTVFRFRMTGTKRAWGYVVQAHFHMVWWDRHHSIYPVG